MNQQDIIEILTKTGCLAETDGEQPIINSMRLLEDPIVTNRLAVELLQQLPEGTRPDVVLCLHKDEMLFAYSVATAAWAKFVACEVDEGRVSFLNGGDIVENDKVLLVDDVLDGSSELIVLKKEIESRKATLIGTTSLFAFSDAEEEGVATYSLLKY